MPEESLFDLHCDACTWHALCGPQDIEKRLRTAGHLRRVEKPTAELVHELLHGVAPQLVCPECGAAGLRLAPYQDEDDWATARRCEICRQPIPPERLEALPEAKRCLKCQQAEDTGQAKVEVEYCRATLRYNGWATLTSGQEIYLSNVPRNLESAELRIVETVLENAV